MNALLLISGLALLGSTSTQENTENEKYIPETRSIYLNSDILQDRMVENDGKALNKVGPKLQVVGSKDPDCDKEGDLDLDEIIFIEDGAEIELGFDTAEYLPENFDPYKLYVDLNSVEYIEDVEEIELNFNINDYLPANFDPYADPSGIMGINYIDDEEVIDLGFDTAEYLPSNFDPYTDATEHKDVTAW